MPCRRLLAAWLLLAAACAPARNGPAAAEEVRLTAAPTALPPGGTLTLALENGSAEPVGYNLCTTALERREGDAWVQVASDRVCTMELRILAPGAREAYPIDLAADLPVGEYRAVTGVEWMERGARTGVASAPFRLRR